MIAPRLWIGKTFYRKINQSEVDGPQMLGQAIAIPLSADSLSGGMRKCSAHGLRNWQGCPDSTTLARVKAVAAGIDSANV